MDGFFTRLRRALRHLATGSGTGRKCFPQAALPAIAAAVGAGEQRHRAEVRLVVEPALPYGAALAGVTNRDRARALFAQYGVWDTEENCGVLIYVNLAEHAVDIVADRNVGRLIADAEWQGVCRTMTDADKRGAFQDGTVAALHHLSLLLERHVPSHGERPHQLPDEPVVV